MNKNFLGIFWSIIIREGSFLKKFFWEIFRPFFKGVPFSKNFFWEIFR